MSAYKPLRKLKPGTLVGFIEPQQLCVGDLIVIYYVSSQVYSPVCEIKKVGESWKVSVEATWKNGERLMLEYAPGDLCEIVMRGKA